MLIHLNALQIGKIDDVARMHHFHRQVRGLAIRNAAKTYMLVDSTKFRRASHIIYTPVSSLHAVITDEGLEAAFREKLEAFSVGLILAPLGEAEQGENK